jgi:hypothetical protein
MRRALLLAVVALAGCGGDSTYAGLTEDEAAVSADRKAAELLEGDADGAMGRAGGSVPGVPLVTLGPRPAPEERAFNGREAWLFSYEVTGTRTGSRACVYVWDGGAAVEVADEC